MTGGAFFPTSHTDDYDLDELGVGGSGSGGGHAVQWVGNPSVRGPKWAKMPLLTVGMLGIQCVWSIEMGYASPYLLDLGLSKSLMSLVFMAGPLSGLIVQPLIGIIADRSKSRYGRRRPFMIAGCLICAFAMMLLGWAREVSGIFGGSTGLSIFLAVWAIYLIDFSINAVMSTDRALVVDTLTTSQQEEGSAWAGRMFGFGSVAGFFVGNLDLPPALPFLGKTQLQILSFVTSMILLFSHSFTSWAVTERVLLRDDRPQSKGGLMANLKSIWNNMFSLPPGIRTVCIVQFFASLGWFPILFFTTVWVSEIYKTSHPELDGSDPTVNADAVRTGARALFFQSLVNIVCSIGLPFLVSVSGVQPQAAGAGEGHEYEALSGGGGGIGEMDAPRSAIWKRTQEEYATGNIVKKTIGWLKEFVEGVRNGEGLAMVIPIRSLTLVRLWWISQYVFAATMAASWFVTSVTGAYFIIAVTGFCWAMSQWAPYALLGELILVEGSSDSAPLVTRTRPSLEHSAHRSPSPQPAPVLSTRTSSRNTPLHSRHASRTSLNLGEGSSKPGSSKYSTPEPSPLIVQTTRMSQDENERSLVLRHSDEDSDDEQDALSSRPNSPRSPISPIGPGVDDAGGAGAGKETADKAGVILGIHNVFLVLPQFIVTFLSSVIFYVMEPTRGLPATHPAAGAGPVLGNGTIGIDEVAAGVGDGVVQLLKREGLAVEGGSSDAVGLIFRIGGVSAAIGAFICMRLARSWARGQGL